jgi:hypothetical protein
MPPSLVSVPRAPAWDVRRRRRLISQPVEPMAGEAPIWTPVDERVKAPDLLRHMHDHLAREERLAIQLAEVGLRFILWADWPA